MPHTTMEYLQMYFSIYPMVLSVIILVLLMRH
jgi:hypothetical protein